MKKITALLILLTLSEVALATTIVCLKNINIIQAPHYLQIDSENEKIEKRLVLADEDKGIYFEYVDNNIEFSERYIKYGNYKINRYSLDWQDYLPNFIGLRKIGKCQISDIKIDVLKKELDEIKNRKRKI